MTPSGSVIEAPTATNDAIVAAGRGQLRVVRVGQRSVADQVFATSPLRLLTPRNHGRAAWIYMSTFGGGLVDGDRIHLDVEVSEGAAAFLATQASTKVYRSCCGTTSDTAARVGPGALLVVLPDPVVCFASAKYRQVQRFDVDADGSLVLVDWITSGRHTTGERWQFASYESALIVSVGGKCVIHDAIALRQNDGDVATRLGRFNVLATVAIVGRDLASHAADAIAAAQRDSVSARSGQVISATPLSDTGCLVRVAGTSCESVLHTVRTLLGFVPELLGDSPWSRKW